MALKKTAWAAGWLLFLFLTGCGGEGGSAVPDGKAFLYEELTTHYLWAEQVPKELDPHVYDDEAELLEALKYQPLDRYSFLVDRESYAAYGAQSENGDGLRVTSNEKGEYVIYDVLDNSPAQHAGVRRGDVIVFAYELGDESRTVHYVLRRDGETYEVELLPMPFQYAVVHAALLGQEELMVGYLRYDAFTEQSLVRLEAAFDGFAAAGVNELVLDLRYNAGGSVAMASILLDKIAGAEQNGHLQFALRFNAVDSAKNEQMLFEKDDNSLAGLNRLVVITTGRTASASELVINALRPYLEVVTIGTTTYGKPVGMEPKLYDDMLYFLINFELVNSEGAGDYYDGIPADCIAADDLSHPLGDPEEGMLAEALHYIETGSCR